MRSVAPLAVALLLALPSILAAEQNEDPTAVVLDHRGTLHGSGFTGEGAAEMKRFSYEQDPGRALQQALSGRLSVQLGPDRSVEVLLEEHELFAPGEKKVRYVSLDGQVLYEEPITSRSFRGSVLQTAEPVSLTIGAWGIYGAITYEGVEHSLQPLPPTDGRFVQEVAFVPRGELMERQGMLPALLDPQADSQTASTTATYSLGVRPVAEPSFWGYHADYVTRISGAFNYGKNMWYDETSINVYLFGIDAVDSNFHASTSEDCGTPGYTDLGLNSFKSYIDIFGSTAENAYVLFHGLNDAGSGQAGCAWRDCDVPPPSGCLHPSGDPNVYTDAAGAVQAIDLTSQDTYNPNLQSHLGKAVAHELTHTAGEPDHPLRWELLVRHR